MNIIKKIKEHGIQESLMILDHKIAFKVNHALVIFFQKLRINKDVLMFESEGDLSDNSFALYQYMQKNGLGNKYHFIWLVDNPGFVRKKFRNDKNFLNTIFLKKVPTHTDIIWSYYIATCCKYIYDHCNLMADFKKRNGQSVIYLSHGFGVKAAKGRSPVIHNFDINVVLGQIPAENAALDWGGTYEQTRQWGYPRNDYLFQDNISVKQFLDDEYRFCYFKKVFLWMPTFRQSIRSSLSENYLSDETGLPLFTTYQELRKFDDFLHSQNVLVVFKIHHLQANLDVFKRKFKNIKVIRDENLIENNIQLYQMVRYTDSLITDYSSISTDYMLLDRPIIYTLDDYEEYKKSRGLSPENALDLLVGYHVFDKNQLEDAITEVALGKDPYHDQRNNMVPQMHKYRDGHSCERIVRNLAL